MEDLKKEIAILYQNYRENRVPTDRVIFKKLKKSGNLEALEREFKDRVINLVKIKMDILEDKEKEELKKYINTIIENFTALLEN